MAIRDLRDWIDEVEKLGELKRLTGAHWDLEIGAITQIIGRRENPPALLFDEIPGYPAGYQVMVNNLATQKRLALCLGLPLYDKPMEAVKELGERIRKLKLIPPKMVSNGPVKENVLEGDEIDMLKFPTPKWHPADGGRYIGTGSVTITRDPEEGWVNLGTYRVMVHNKNTLGFYISPGKHGRLHREKCQALGLPCRVAVSFGHDPLLYLTSAVEIPYGVCEYDYVGGLKGEPVEVIEGSYSGLPIPAHAEIVIEGEADLENKIMEGPFGEWTGYYGSGIRPEPIIKVKRLMHRNAPIILAAPHSRPPWETTTATALYRSALMWNELEAAGIPDVKGGWFHPAGGGQLFIVVAIKQRYPGHARQAGLVATGCHTGASCGRYVVVVDDDIGPSDTNEVIWAMSTRSDPEKSIEIIRRCWTNALDPTVKPGTPLMNTRAIIDACRPFEWIEEFPPVVGFDQAELDKVMKKWGKQLFD